MIFCMQMLSDIWPVTYRWTWRDSAAVVLLFCLAWGVYANSLYNDFTYDDHAVVVGDTRSHSLSRIGEIFSGGYWTVTKRTLYRPMTHLSFALNHALTGLSAPGYRAVNITLHGLICVALYRLMTVLFGQFWPAVVAAAVFAVLPIHVEAVAPIVGRSEVLSTVLVLMAMVLYAGDAASGGRGPSWRYALALLLSLGAMLTKENAIVLVALVPAFDIWRRLCAPASERKGGWESYLTSRFFWRYGGFLVMVIIVLSMRRYALGMVLGEGIRFPRVDNPLPYESMATRWLTGLVLLGKYVYLMLVGHPLSNDYSYDAIPVARSIDARVVWGGLCLLALVGAGFLSLRSRRQVLVAVGWFLITYAPVANVLVLIGTIFAERLMYLPSVALAMVWGLTLPALTRWLWHRGSRGAAVVVIGVLGVAIIAYSVLTVSRNRVWRNDEVLFADGLARQPGSARVQYNYGAWCASHGKIEPALKHLRRAVEISGEYFLARTRLASCQLGLSRWQDTVDTLRPLVQDASSRSEHLISPLGMMAKAHTELRQFGEALRCHERALRIDPECVAAMSGKAAILADPNTGPLYKPAEGWALVQEAVQLQPEDLAALMTAAGIAIRRQRFIEAQLYVQRAYSSWGDKVEEARERRPDPSTMRTLRMIQRELDRLHDELVRQVEARRSGTTTTTTTPTSMATATQEHRPPPR